MTMPGPFSPSREFSLTKARRILAANPAIAVTGVLFLVPVLWIVWNVLDWAVLHAVFSAGGRESCLAPDAGACWSVIANRWRLIFFGLYPFEEHWRSGVACLIIVLVGALSCLSRFWRAGPLALLWISGFAWFYLLMRGGWFGLAPVFPQSWGGLSLTIFVFSAVIILGMPLSILLALMRRSKLPVIAEVTGAIIDTIRGLPLLAVLFSFAVVLPFVIPGWLAGDKLFRLITGFTLFFACYQAEILRSGIQALPVGQEEAACALGMSYWHRISRIVLPQAFRHALPPTINQFVTTFKDTTLITIVGFFEVMGSGAAAYGTAEWQFANREVYVFVGLIFFVFVFSLSRYGAHLERRLTARSR